MKKTYTVIVHYEGAFDYTIEATTEEEANRIAEERFQNETSKSIANNIADSFVCDTWENKE